MFEVTCLDINGEVITNLTQWDTNQSLIIENTGLSSAPVFHFCNKNSKEALVVPSTMKNGVITVNIPNILLQEGIPMLVYLYAYSSLTSGKTLATIKIPVRPRPKPSEYNYIENIDVVSVQQLRNDIASSLDSIENLVVEVNDDFDSIKEQFADMLEDFDTLSGDLTDSINAMKYYGDGDITYTPTSNFEWTISFSRDYASVSGYHMGSDTDVVIPYEYESQNATLPVLNVAADAFLNKVNLTSVIIPLGVTGIGDEAFRNCANLTSVNIPDSVTYVGEESFKNCSSLTSLTIPDSVTEIGDNAFVGCAGNFIIICNSGSYAETYAKNNNIPVKYDIVSLAILQNQIGDLTDLDTTAKNNLVVAVNEVKSGLDSEIENVSDKAKALKYYGDVSVVPTAQSDFTWTVSGNNATVTGYTGSDTDIVIPYEYELGNIVYTVTSIGASAFINLYNLTSITIPNSVTSIGNYAINTCGGLTNITIPDSVTSIGNSAFGYSYSLTNITIPDGVTSIGDYMFINCSSLTNITIPDSVTSIGDYAFVDCSSLTNITIPDSVTSIGNDVFHGRSNDFTIICSQGSAAETYAKSNNIPVKYDVVDLSGYATKEVWTKVVDINITEDTRGTIREVFANSAKYSKLRVKLELVGTGSAVIRFKRAMSDIDITPSSGNYLKIAYNLTTKRYIVFTAEFDVDDTIVTNGSSATTNSSPAGASLITYGSDMVYSTDQKLFSEFYMYLDSNVLSAGSKIQVWGCK